MANLTIRYESTRKKSSSKNIDNFIRETIDGLHQMRKNVEEKNVKLSCSLPCSLFTKKFESGRE
ncbi:MAG TPA: hypothetical protein VK435_07805 [Thermodesulfovibrionales bacterium]|nr:hypothetical protein [Thermodesulfovibrionales bacterium]